MLVRDGSTGRISRILTATARRILFERTSAEDFDEDLTHLSRVDRAHVLMLAETGIIGRETAARLIKAINQLAQKRFEPLKARSSYRGTFLLYEDYLIETEGPAIGGILQTGRSRNDLNATLLKLRLRKPYVKLISSLLRLQAVLIQRAIRYGDVVMPAYTHSQAAEPITYGHYLAGFAEALRRDINGLIDASAEMESCPLGAGAIAGTSLPIDTNRTAALLGFCSSKLNSVDAVASRDLVFRLLAGMAILGCTLSRAATDLLQWSTAEFQFLWLPDELIGSSSAMPQKRNPFLLEHVQGRTASLLGAFVQSLSASRNTPFTNSIATGTEAVRPIWGAFADLTDAITLLRLVVGGARPNVNAMASRAAEGFTNATAVAVRMVTETGLDFRSAHRRVGEMVSEALSRSLTSLQMFAEAAPNTIGISLSGLDPASIVAEAKYGGGPAPENLNRCLLHLREDWSRQRRWLKAQTAHSSEANAALERCAAAFVAAELTETGGM
jgi:argininosuccinate lyase